MVNQCVPSPLAHEDSIPHGNILPLVSLNGIEHDLLGVHINVSSWIYAVLLYRYNKKHILYRICSVPYQCLLMDLCSAALHM